ncbi:L-rhamnose-binding lectin SML-like [Pelmatolapia mariae]|uniref:L-rhamnose-binding lectin SML-like n=1 Tax=Pelmatolapia mariae TaxID=158779 RepID=UPI002FE5A1E3
MLERICLSADLGTPWSPPRGAGGSCWGGEGFIRAQVSFPPNVTAISTGRVVTSNGLNVHRLSCVGGRIIVRSAVYRCGGEVICSQGDAENNVRNSCDGKTVCDIKSNITYDPGVCKYLETTYDCFPHYSVTCEKSQANLQCGEGQVIVVSWANFGRRDTTTCPDGDPDHVKNVNCLSPNSGEYVTNRCNWQNSCTVGASNTVFGDPCGGTCKYLEVFYTCQAHPMVVLRLARIWHREEEQVSEPGAGVVMTPPR